VEPVIRECVSIEDLDNCVALQREAFSLPELEISPRRHLIVSRQAGGWTLGAFDGDRLVGFVHHLAAVCPNNEVFGYSHMMAVAKDYQNKGIGARLKWAQRERALTEGRGYIKWTWDPMQARNAHFNLNRLGVVVESFGNNFYGTDYDSDPAQKEEGQPGLQSDRLFASWYLNSRRVCRLASGEDHKLNVEPVTRIAVPVEWSALKKSDVAKARREQERVRTQFIKALSDGLVCAAFERGDTQSHYLLFEKGSFNAI
jgi:predicted GNAT superfamily acetyltransferase